MALPSGLTTGTVTLTGIIDSSGAPANGSITFTPTPKLLRGVGIGATILPTATTVAIAEGAGPATTLISTDNAQLNPANGWTWVAEGRFDGFGSLGGRLGPFAFQLAAGATKNIAELIPVQESAGVITVQGPAGTGGTGSATDDNDYLAAFNTAAS